MSPSSTSSSDGSGRGPDPALIGTAPDPAGTGDRVVARADAMPADDASRRARVGALAVFALVVGGTTLTDLLAPLPPVKPIGAEAQQQARQRRDARFADGTLAKLIEDDWRRVSRVRRTLLGVYVPLLYRCFGEVRSDLVYGDGYLFLHDRLPVGADRDALLGRAAGWLRGLGRMLERAGSRLVVAPIPRKAALMEQHLPAGVDPRADYDAALVPAFRAVGVDTVDLWTALRRPDEEPPYSRPDSHWSAAGATAAARAIAADLRAPAPAVDVELAHADRDMRPTLAGTLGLEPWAQRWLPPLFERSDGLVDPGAADVVFEPPATGPLPVLLVGSSFSRNSDGSSTWFGTALSAYAGARIWNGALAGQTPGFAMAQALRPIDDGRVPPVVVMELPDHFVVRAYSHMWTLAQACVELPVRGLVPLPERAPGDDGARFTIPALQRGRVPAPGARVELDAEPIVLRVPWGEFYYPLDGTIAAVLRGRVDGGRVLIATGRDEDRLTTVWDGRRTEVGLPVAGYGMGHRLDAALSAQAGGGRPVLQLDAFELATDLDVDRAPLPLGATSPVGSGWSRVADASAAGLGIDDCIGVVLSGTDGDSRCAVTAALDGGGEVALFGPAPISAKATLLLPLRPAAGRGIRSVTVQDLNGAASAPQLRVFPLPRRRLGG